MHIHNGSHIHQICIHYQRPVITAMTEVTNSEQAEALLRTVTDAERLDHKEFFWVILLTNALQVLGVSEISIGSDRGTLIHAKEIFQLALVANASSVILCHNHPSGKRTPSIGDKALTEAIYQFGRVMSIDVRDHIILTSEGYFSFADEGLI